MFLVFFNSQDSPSHVLLQIQQEIYREAEVRGRLEKEMEAVRREKKQLAEQNHVSTRKDLNAVMSFKAINGACVWPIFRPVKIVIDMVMVNK